MPIRSQVTVNSAFDGGNAEFLGQDADGALRLRMRPDEGTGFMQWFHFRVAGIRGSTCVIHIENAGEATYPDGFRDYRAVATCDRQTWFRVPTEYDGRRLTIRHHGDCDAVYFAYFAPFSSQRHANLVARAQHAPGVRAHVLGRTVDGRDLDMLQFGEDGPGRRRVWLVARQHPGETMAEWWMEGMVQRLTDPDDAVARALMERAVVYMVPNMNPDGSARGYLRSNAAGANLNREWSNPCPERSPEVYHVRGHMHTTGVDLCLDVHGDEVLPYCFIAGFDGIPNLRPGQIERLHEFRHRLASQCPDFQVEHGYPVNAPGSANLGMCANYVAEAFGCLSMTLEMPFKDNALRPDPERGWSPGRSRLLAGACLGVMQQMLDNP